MDCKNYHYDREEMDAESVGKYFRQEDIFC